MAQSKTAKQSPPEPKESTIIAVMGAVGAGRSTFINYASRQNGKVLIGHNLKPCTKEIRPIMTKFGEQRVIFIDTPGLDDANMTDTFVLGLIAEWLRKTYDGKAKLACIVYMHRVSDNRLTGPQLKNLNMIAHLCGSEAAEKLVLVTTMWGTLALQHVGVKREADLMSKHWKDLMDKGARCARFETSFDLAWDVIGRVCVSMRKEKLLLEEEMVDLGRKLSETGPGKNLLQTIQERLSEEERLLNELSREGGRQGKPEQAKDLHTQYAQVRQQLEETFKQLQSMKIPLGRRIVRFSTSKAP